MRLRKALRRVVAERVQMGDEVDEVARRIGSVLARTADDLSRYHSKLMIIDRRELYLTAFNFTCLDIEHSRSFPPNSLTGVAVTPTPRATALLSAGVLGAELSTARAGAP